MVTSPEVAVPTSAHPATDALAGLPTVAADPALTAAEVRLAARRRALATHEGELARAREALRDREAEETAVLVAGEVLPHRGPVRRAAVEVEDLERRGRVLAAAVVDSDEEVERMRAAATARVAQAWRDRQARLVHRYAALVAEVVERGVELDAFWVRAAREGLRLSEPPVWPELRPPEGGTDSRLVRWAEALRRHWGLPGALVERLWRPRVRGEG